ncbi:hypothetical protein M422DRAFT_75634 [Sphaerobolus stellatus SS14]|uniref:FAD-binding domain-containing protein n=1 Tax=Sphaerobolus stellatus (strain SS14) TaxID=990650 RepID=A0A0C9V2N9_SPHS4|nr:hypothetical protein M422DRAFT_75634 [Sphaerobolus stellatus SS14]
MIWGKTWRILELLDLADEASKIAHAPPSSALGIGFDFRRSDQASIGERFLLAEMPYGCIRFHRAEFLDVFVNHLPTGVAHFRKRVKSYEQDTPGDPITLHFNDGSTAECDVLVGADGVKSMVRAEMLKHIASTKGNPDLLDLIDPFFSGTIAYRGLIPVDKMPKGPDGSPHRTIRSPMMYCGKSKHVVSYSISQGSIVNVVTFASEPEKEGAPAYDGPWVTEVSKQELLDCYANWEPEVVDMLNCIERPTKWAMHQLKHLPNYVDGRVALLGDAAHAMTPHQGAGAGQAIEDAYVLAGILGDHHTQLDNIDTALRAYDHMRRPLASHVLQGSRDAGRMYEFNGPQGEHYETLCPAIQRQWEWIWASTPEEDLENALKWMKEQ